MKEELLQLFPTPLLIVPYEQPIDKELTFLKTISYRKQEQNGNFRSDDSYLLRNEEFKDIKNFLGEAINKFTTNVLNTKQRLVITQCWANRNPKGSKHHEHVHPNSIVSGVMYFQINENVQKWVEQEESFYAFLMLCFKILTTINFATFFFWNTISLSLRSLVKVKKFHEKNNNKVSKNFS